MRYTVVGANKETGEDVEVVVEADTPEAAAKKASSLGLFVHACKQGSKSRLASSQNQRSTDISKGLTPLPASQSPSRKSGGLKRIVRNSAILMAIVVVTIGLIWKFALQPRDEAIQKTMADAVKQLDKTAAMQQAQSQVQIEIADRRLLAVKSEGNEDAKSSFLKRLTNDSKLTTKLDVIQGDPVVRPLVAGNTTLLSLIREEDDGQHYYPQVTDELTKMNVDAVDKAYVRRFMTAISALP